MIARPKTDEYAPYYGRYIELVPEGGDVYAIMQGQPGELRALLKGVSEEQANVRPAPGEWSIKEVVGHIADTERVFAYRAVWVARDNTIPLPGFDQDDFVRATEFNARPLADIVDEFDFQRRANLLLIKSLTDAEFARRGTASENPVTARSLLFMMAGHVVWHVNSLKTDYHVGG